MGGGLGAFGLVLAVGDFLGLCDGYLDFVLWWKMNSPSCVNDPELIREVQGNIDDVREFCKTDLFGYPNHGKF